MIQEVDRELASSGITVPVKHYQNQILEGEDQLTKELIGVEFTITHPQEGVGEMLEFMFKDEAKNILDYCNKEFGDRLNPEGVNPGESYKIREDLWQKLMSKTSEGKFDYTYSERYHPHARNENGYQFNQVQEVIDTLKEDEHSRRAMLMVFFPEDTLRASGAATRIPCSVSYQFLIRNNKLQCIYYIRSNDYFKHFPIDITLTSMLMEWVRTSLMETYPGLKPGALHYFAGSLHAYNEDLKNWVIF